MFPNKKEKQLRANLVVFLALASDGTIPKNNEEMLILHPPQLPLEDIHQRSFSRTPHRLD